MFKLVILVFAGAFANGDSVTLDHISGFFTKNECLVTGNSLSPLVEETKKDIRFVCIKTTNE